MSWRGELDCDVSHSECNLVCGIDGLGPGRAKNGRLAASICSTPLPPLGVSRYALFLGPNWSERTLTNLSAGYAGGALPLYPTRHGSTPGPFVAGSFVPGAGEAGRDLSRAMSLRLPCMRRWGDPTERQWQKLGTKHGRDGRLETLISGACSTASSGTP